MAQSTPTIICQHCRTGNSTGAAFCNGCGHPLPLQTNSATITPKPVEIFLSYSHRDAELKDHFLDHMAILGRGRTDRAIVWHDLDIRAGVNWRQQIGSHLQTADIIILLISASFIASDYCYSNEMVAAMERHDRGEATVIPIIVRPAVWHDAPFHKLQALPHNAKPVSTWPDEDSAWVDVVEEIERIL